MRSGTSLVVLPSSKAAPSTLAPKVPEVLSTRTLKLLLILGYFRKLLKRMNSEA